MNMKPLSVKPNTPSRNILCDARAWSFGSETYIATGTQSFNPRKK